MEDQLSQLQSRYEKFCKLALSAGEERAQQVKDMVESLGERLLMCPGSLNEGQPWSRPGGLIDQSIAVTMKMRSIAKALDISVPTESLVIVGLFHNVGMVGGPLDGDDYLVDQDSDWHRKQGRLYRYNENLPKMPIAHRSLHILQHFGIRLTMEEWVAVATSTGPSREENRFYIGSEPDLSVLLTQSRQWILKGHNT
jgi:hypothetical protein